MGFAPTYTTELIWGNVGIARLKLDWILVKDDVTKPRDQNAPYVFASHFARTLY